MKALAALALCLLTLTIVHAQNEQSPIVEKDIKYKNWTFKDSRTGADVDLRDVIKGSKLAIVDLLRPVVP